ncbi:LuxR C-terminal-related transcriptional regulator [Microbacterium sp. A93]|uniref:LuxR C-terminal-related transcriptional regulator n=1 Tax=Microbacterium sp. A93 TaxID=3450716 RepID=UPI003F42722C
MLNAPAGSGKSTLATQLLRSPLLEQFRVYSIHGASARGQSIWHSLGRCLAAAEPAPLPDDDAYSREWVHARISALTEPTLFLLDDYHGMTTAEHDRALLALGESNPHFHVCVLARSVRVLDGPLYMHRVRVIDRNELAFTAEESLDLAAQSGVELSAGLTEAFSQADGWPVAVAAVLRTAHETENAPRRDGARIGESIPAPAPVAAHPALQRVAIDILDVLRELDPHARVALLGASLVGSFSLDHAAEFIGKPAARTQSHIDTLLQLGVLVRLAHGAGYRVHPSVRATLPDIAAQEFSTSKRKALVLRAAQEMEKSNPFDAFRIYLRSSSLAAAETVLWSNFTAITDRSDACLAALSPLNDAELFAHPTLAAARFFLEFESSTVAPKRFWHTSQLSHAGAQRRLKLNPDPADPLHIGHRMQVMIGERMQGNAPAALAIAQDIEARLTSHGRLEDPDLRTSGNNEPVLLEELAFTAFMGGDSALARRVWQRLSILMERMSEGASSDSSGGAPHATLRPGPWQHAALSGLALVESNEGDFRRGAELLAHSDQLRDEYGPAPGLAWVNAEIVRAHHAYEFRRPDLLRQAIERTLPWCDRIEQWPMLIMAEAESVRYQRGTDWALPQLRAGIAQIERERHGVGVWGGYLALYQAMLHATSGNFAASKQIMDALPARNPFVQIGRARFALFQGNNVQALLLIQRLGPAALNLRQQIDRFLIAAIAAWACGRTEEAFDTLRSAGELISRCQLSMMLRSVPFEPLAELAAAARDAGVCDVVALINSVPELARCVMRESLTQMEQRSLESMITHPSLADAAVALAIAPATVKRHRLTVYRKLKVGGREEAILQATRMGLLQRPGSSDEKGPVTPPT